MHQLEETLHGSLHEAWAAWSKVQVISASGQGFYLSTLLVNMSLKLHLRISGGSSLCCSFSQSEVKEMREREWGYHNDHQTLGSVPNGAGVFYGAAEEQQTS